MSGIRTSTRAWIGPAVVAGVAWLAVVVAIDPAGDYPDWPQGPGLTVDESFNVGEGVRLVAALEGVGLGMFDLADAFREPDDSRVVPPAGFHLADHPPLGRLWIGIVHAAVRPVWPPHDPSFPFTIACARVAPATAFALAVFIVGLASAQWHGTLAGTFASVAVVLMPRVFGHAHLAALESFIGLTYAAATVSVAHFWGNEPSSRLRTTCWTGCVFGLALLTKIQAVLLPVPIAVWALWRWRTKAVLPLLVWGATGVAVFFVGWPWLWHDPWDHVCRFLGSTTQRVTLHTWYFGEKIADRDVPWHYPAVLFLVTVPVGLHVLGGLGLVTHLRRQFSRNNPTAFEVCLNRHGNPFHDLSTLPADVADVRATDSLPSRSGSRETSVSPELSRVQRTPGPRMATLGTEYLAARGLEDTLKRELQLIESAGTETTAAHREPRETLVLLCLLFPLLVFSWPGVAVYDGVRLFLVSFPLWAIFVGRGVVAAHAWLCQAPREGAAPTCSNRQATLLLSIFVALQSYGLIAYHPCHLSYYNLAVGGLRGAERLGFEPTYWGDSVTRSFLQAVTDAVPRGAVIELVPVLHQFQLADLRSQSPILRRHQIELRPFGATQPGSRRYVLAFQRKDALPPNLSPPDARSKVLAQLVRDGVSLAVLYELPRSP